MEKNKKTRISFDYKGTHYVLEYTADALKKMERDGFKFTKIEDSILTAPEELFAGAFWANHATTPRKVRLEIYKELEEMSGEGDDSITDALAVMLEEAITEITTHKGNVKWSVEK